MARNFVQQVQVAAFCGVKDCVDCIDKTGTDLVLENVPGVLIGMGLSSRIFRVMTLLFLALAFATNIISRMLVVTRMAPLIVFASAREVTSDAHVPAFGGEWAGDGEAAMPALPLRRIAPRPCSCSSLPGRI